MIRTILVPLDGSDLSERAVPFASALARKTGASIRLLRAALTMKGRSEDAAEFNRRVLSEAEKELSPVASRLRDTGLSVGWSVEPDEAAWAILNAARQSADLVVMSTHGRGGLGRFLYGSIAERVLQRAVVPVFLVPAGAGDCDCESRSELRFVLPLDGTTASEQPLPMAVELASALGAEIVLVHAVQPLSVWAAASPYVRFDPAEERARASVYLGGIAGRCAGVRTICLVREGIASDVVVDVAREYAASLIVLATRARTGMARVLLGSVADSVLGRAGVPLLLTRIGARSKRAARPSEG